MERYHRVKGSFAVSILIMMGLLSIVISVTDDIVVSGHAPTQMELDYELDDQLLFVTITHSTPTPSSHYVEAIIVYRNDIPIIEEEYDDQPSRQTFTYEFSIYAVDGDVLKAWAECNIGGDLEEEITIEGPKEYMTLVVNPNPEAVEMDEEVPFTVTIYREEDETPLDGVTVVPRADLGYVSEIDELALGGYGFSYTAPALDNEDIEVINLSCTKNGYHPLYFEFSFDIIFTLDMSRVIQVSIEPTVYRLDEGETKEFSVTVKAGGVSLDIPDLDVDYSKGKLSTTKVGTGRYTLKYTANYVDADTTGFIKVTAIKSGYSTDADEIQFQITDLGDIQEDNGSEESFFEKNLTYIIIAAVAILIIAGMIIFFRRKKQEPEYPEEQYPVEVEAVEVVEEQYYQEYR